MRLAGLGQHDAQHFLGAGLAGAAGYGRDPRIRPLPRGAGQRVQRFERVRHAEQRAEEAGSQPITAESPLTPALSPWEREFGCAR